MKHFYDTFLYQWLQQRLSVEGIINFLKKKTVPVHKHSFWYYFGGMTLFLYLLQVATGMLLLLYYRPSAETAFESIQFIMTQVHFGWLIRSIHSWSANLLVFFAFVHMFSVFMLKGYRFPRELTWITGVLSFFLMLGFGFTGYLLPWNTLSFFATKVGTDIAGVLPGIGNFLLIFLRGGEDVTGATLTRLFGFHVAVLPLTTFVLLGIHLALIQKQGMSSPIGVKVKREISFIPNFLTQDIIGWLSVLGLLAILAALYPWELGVKADPFASAPEGIKPEWYFVFMFQTLKFVPAKLLIFDGEVIAIISFGIIGLFWICVPFLDRWSNREQKNPIFTWIGIIGIIYILVLTVMGYIL